MINPRILLNKFKWHEKYDIKNVEIWYVHRGALDDTMIITGEDICDIGRSFMKTTSAMIPYHRIFKIKYNNDTIFQREK